MKNHSFSFQEFLSSNLCYHLHSNISTCIWIIQIFWLSIHFILLAKEQTPWQFEIAFPHMYCCFKNKYVVSRIIHVYKFCDYFTSMITAQRKLHANILLKSSTKTYDHQDLEHCVTVLLCFFFFFLYTRISSTQPT